MRVLAITYITRVPDNIRLYESLEQHVELEHMQIDRHQALNLDKTLADIDLLSYDRVVLELRAKHVMKHWRSLWKIPNLVLFEEDTWQNYASFSKNYGYFTKYFNKAQPGRILHSGFEVAQKTRHLGFDSCFLPKGFDGGRLRNLHIERDIELGFIGRVKHKNYVHRKNFLEKMEQHAGLALLRTYSDEEYLTTLNRIRFFISADIQFGEHMIKNFEAMACGCVLFAYRQGADDESLGLVDMQTAVLYSDQAELDDKIIRLRNDPALAEQIAANGQALAEANHDLWHLGTCYYQLLARPLASASAERMRRWSHAAMHMSAATLATWTSHCLYAGSGKQALYQHASNNLRTFNQPSSNKLLLWKKNELSLFLERHQQLAAKGINVPRVSCWGEQQDSHMQWLVHSPCQLTAPADLQHADIHRLISSLHQAGMWLNSFNQDDFGWDQQGALVWLNPASLSLQKQPLDAAAQRHNIELLRASPDLSNHSLAHLLAVHPV